jgi:hypothetical protein
MQVVSPGRLLLGSAAAASAAAASGSAPQPQQQKVVPVEQQKFFEVKHENPDESVPRRSGMPLLSCESACQCQARTSVSYYLVAKSRPGLFQE